MAVNSQNEALHYEGVLEKAGKRFFEGFRRRWFILDGKNLSYYKAPETTPENLLGIIDLTKVKAVNPFKMINNNAFQIITSTRTYTFTAATPQLMTEWISVLRQAMQIQSFRNKRAQKSTSTHSSSQDEEGYEVVSRSSRSSSDMSNVSCNDQNLYDQVTSPVNKDAPQSYPISTYEAVGSFKRHSNSSQSGDQDSYGVIAAPAQKIEASESVGPSSGASPPDGTYGKIWDSPVQDPNMYSTVQKPLNPTTQDIASKPVEELYADVNVETKPAPKITVTPMPVICESDDDNVDDDDAEENNDDDAIFTYDNNEDPLPPPKGSSYAADQIRMLLSVKDENGEPRQESHAKDDEITTLNVIPDTCEKAFSKLREFLTNLENN